MHLLLHHLHTSVRPHRTLRAGPTCLGATVAVLVLAATAVVAGGRADTRWAVGVFPSGAEFSLELAVTDDERARGYMFRERVGEREGMLFLFEATGRHGFWMKNCRVALDLIWLDEGLNVVHIAHQQAPCPAEGDCPSIVPFQAGRYVLEVAAGTARSQNLRLGDRIVVLPDPSRR